MVNIFILFIFYFLILFSLIGYGTLFVKFFTREQIIQDFGYLGILGILFALLISYVSNLILPHGYLFNCIFIFVGILSFTIFIKNNFNLLKKDFLLLIFVFLFLSIALIMFKNHDDFPYYHFSYTYNLTQFDLLVGTGQFNHGFRTPSSIFYLNSLFYLPFIKYFSFNFSSVYILGFVNIIFLKNNGLYTNVFKLNKSKILKNYKLTNYLATLSFIFINVFFYRIGEYGTDRAAQILILVLVFEIFRMFENIEDQRLSNLKIYSLITIIISLKAFYILYLLFFIPIFTYYLKKYKLTKTINENFKQKYILIYLLIFVLVLLTYFFNTGCLIYPLHFTCFENLSWSIPKEQVIAMNNHYQTWAKAGMTPNYKVGNPEEYIKYFNWVGGWIDGYFFNKISDFLLGVFFLCIVFIITFLSISSGRKKISFNKYHLYSYLIIVLLFFEWFYNHPSLRYGGFCLIALLTFIPLSFFLSSYTIEIKKFNKAIIILILISLSVFIVRNISRIDKEIDFYKYKPLSNIFYYIDEKHFAVYNQVSDFIKEYEMCKVDITCKDNKNPIYEIFGKYIFRN
jgi:hypothetical protein